MFHLVPTSSKVWFNVEAYLLSDPEQRFLGLSESDAVQRLKIEHPFKFSFYDRDPFPVEPKSEHFFSSPEELTEILMSQEELGDQFDIETPDGLLQRSIAEGGIDQLWNVISHFIPIDSDGGAIRSCFLDSRRYAEYCLDDSGSYRLRFY